MCDLCADVRDPAAVTVAPDDPSDWAHTYRVFALGHDENAAWNRAYLERHGLTARVEELERSGAGLRREPRAGGEEFGDG